MEGMPNSAFGFLLIEYGEEYDTYDIDVVTGPEFGCIHHTPKSVDANRVVECLRDNDDNPLPTLVPSAIVDGKIILNGEERDVQLPDCSYPIWYDGRLWLLVDQTRQEFAALEGGDGDDFCAQGEALYGRESVEFVFGTLSNFHPVGSSWDELFLYMAALSGKLDMHSYISDAPYTGSVCR